MAVSANQYSSHKRSASQAQFHRHRHTRQSKWNGAQHDAHKYADKNGEHIGVVEALHRVAQALCQAVDVFQLTHHCDAVAHMQGEVGAGKEV